MYTNNSYFKSNRLVFMGKNPEAHEAAQQGSEKTETPLDKANREAAEAIRAAENKAAELRASKASPKKRAWGYQLAKEIKDHEPLRQRILDARNKNLVLANNVAVQFKGALRTIAKWEAALPAGERAEPVKKAEKAEAEKRVPEKKAAESDADSIEAVFDKMTMDSLIESYKEAILRINQIVKETNENWSKQIGRNLDPSEKIYSPYEAPDVAKLRSPRLSQIYSRIHSLKADPGKTRSAIEASTREIERISRPSAVKEAINQDQIESILRGTVSIMEYAANKRQNELLIRRAINKKRTEDPLFSAKPGSWDILTGEGIYATITKNKDHDYKVEIKTLSDIARKTYKKVAMDLKYPPLPGEKRAKAPASAVAKKKPAKKPTAPEISDLQPIIVEGYQELQLDPLTLYPLIRAAKLSENNPSGIIEYPERGRKPDEVKYTKYKITYSKRGPTPHYKIEEA